MNTEMERVALLTGQVHRLLGILMELAPSSGRLFEKVAPTLVKQLGMLQDLTENEDIVPALLNIPTASTTTVEILEGGVRGDEVAQLPAAAMVGISDEAYAQIQKNLEQALIQQSQNVLNQVKTRGQKETRDTISRWVKSGAIAISSEIFLIGAVYIYVVWHLNAASASIGLVAAGGAAAVDMATDAASDLTGSIRKTASSTVSAISSTVLGLFGQVAAEAEPEVVPTIEPVRPTFSQRFDKQFDDVSGALTNVIYTLFGKNIHAGVPFLMFIAVFVVLTITMNELIKYLNELKEKRKGEEATRGMEIINQAMQQGRSHAIEYQRSQQQARLADAQTQLLQLEVTQKKQQMGLIKDTPIEEIDGGRRKTYRRRRQRKTRRITPRS